MRIKKTLALAAVLAQLVPLSALAANDSYVSLTSSAGSVDVGGTFTVSLMVYPGSHALDTARVSLYYPTSLLDVVSTQLSGGFGSELPGNAMNDAVGTVTIGGFKASGNVSSPVQLATVTFKAVGSGTANIEVLNASHLLSEGYDYADSTKFGEASVTISGDSTTTTADTKQEGDLLNLDLSAQQRALGYFGAFTGRMPSNAEDWEAHRCMWYASCEQDNDAQEAVSLAAFKAKFNRAPADDLENYVLDALTKHYALFGLEKASETTTAATTTVGEYDEAKAKAALAQLPADASDFSAWNPSADIMPGDTSLDVAYLQRFLKAYGDGAYPQGLVTAYYGSFTKSAVLRYQYLHGITQTGNVGALTRAEILKALGR